VTEKSNIPKKALIIAHYHRHGLVRDDTLDLIKTLNSYFEKIIFVSTNLLENEKIKFPESVEIIVRENLGYDFYSYRNGLLRLQEDDLLWNELQKICLMNTSFCCFNSELLFKNFFQTIENKNYQAISLVKTNIIKKHLQSFLFVLDKSVFQRQAVLAWWQNMIPISDRARVILELEIGFSQFLVQQKIPLKGLYHRKWSTQCVNALKAGPLKLLKILKIRHYKKIRNVTFADYLHIYEKYGIVKIELLQKNTFEQDTSVFINALKASPIKNKVLIQALEN
jgi:Rhamnan synthesis protein F